jgi:GT2 family glycosyltransferase
MHVAVAIIGFRNVDDIVRCLDALSKSTYEDFEVVICENGGQAAFDALTSNLDPTLKGGQPVRAILAPRNLGYGGGLNVCFEATPNADAWWVLNPDTLVGDTAMAALVARLERGDAQAVGCTLHLADGRVQSHGGQWQSWLARAISIGHSSSRGATVDPEAIERRQNYLNGASMMVDRRFLEDAGPLREEYFLYSEEVEWCLRARGRGLRLGFAPDARVLHYQGTTTGHGPNPARRSRLSIYLSERNKILLTRDHFATLMPLAAPAALLSFLWRCLRNRAWRQVEYGLAGWVAGLRNERGAPSWMESDPPASPPPLSTAVVSAPPGAQLPLPNSRA